MAKKKVKQRAEAMAIKLLNRLLVNKVCLMPRNEEEARHEDSINERLGLDFDLLVSVFALLGMLKKHKDECRVCIDNLHHLNNVHPKLHGQACRKAKHGMGLSKSAVMLHKRSRPTETSVVGTPRWLFMLLVGLLASSSSKLQ